MHLWEVQVILTTKFEVSIIKTATRALLCFTKEIGIYLKNKWGIVWAYSKVTYNIKGIPH